MKRFCSGIYLAISVSTGVVSAGWCFSAPTTTPAGAGSPTQSVVAQPGARTAQELMRDISSDQKTVNSLVGKDDAVLKNAADRAAAAPGLITALKKTRVDLDALAVVEPKYKTQTANAQPNIVAMLSVLGDKDSSDKIQSMLDSKDPAEAITGQSEKFMGRWMVAEKTVPAQTPLVDDLEKLDKAHADSTALTVMTAQLSRDAASSDLNQRMLDIATNEMNNRAASAIKQQVAAMKAAKDGVAAAENKPLTISGQAVDGKAFTSADLKGKVILVDFWATWCGPCREELPRVKKMYSDYHDKGLMILGVSNDFNVEALKGFTAKEEMPWTELFDSSAAANNQWNPITLAQGISGIPTMFLIDKKGVCRSVAARENMEELIPKLLAESD